MHAHNLGDKFSSSCRPSLETCNLCGQRFGSTSIGIHAPQCYAKQLAQWESANPATRGSKPKPPDAVNGNKSFCNDEPQEFDSTLTPSAGLEAGATLPDQITVFPRTSKARAAMTTLKTGSVVATGGGGGGGRGGGVAHFPPSHSLSRAKSGTTSPARPPGMRPILPSCYLCGRQFGTTSIGIHVPQCYAKKLAQWELAEVATRGAKPRHPDAVNWRGAPGTAVAEQAELQFREFLHSLEVCPHCGRKFLADRLVVHLRSCRAGHAARPAPHARRPTGGLEASMKAASTSSVRLSSPGLSGRGSLNVELLKADRPTTDLRSRLVELSRTSSLKERLPGLDPRGHTSHLGRTCHHCRSVEYNSSAKFCRECGWNLNTENLPNPCKRCGEVVPATSRYCGTCGEPVADPASAEREPGWGNENAPMVHMTTCPACRALCCDDANFCDNCGAALLEQSGHLPKENGGIPGSSGASKEEGGGSGGGGVNITPRSAKSCPMYCKTCDLHIKESFAVYCEDCGGKLEKRAAPEGSKNPESSTESGALPRVNVSRGGGGSSSSAGAAVAPLLNGGKFESEEWAGSGVRESCRSCGRQFAPEILQKHIRKCASQKKKRPVFNIHKKWIEGLEPVPRRSNGVGDSGRNKAGGGGVVAAPPKKNWKAESEAFRRALREAKQVDQILKSGGNVRDLPPPTYSENPDYVPCPHCQRRFAPKAAERHIPHCAVTINKPKPPPKRRGV